jgi:glycosyltransferase involved in cell wall biosynthesis
VGAEGLPLTPGEHYLAADTPADFARAVVELLRDVALRRQLGEAGRRLVEARYSWAETGRCFEALLEDATAPRRATARQRWPIPMPKNPARSASE